MTKLLNKALKAISKLPADRQDQLAEIILDVAKKDPYPLSAAEEAAIAEGRKDIAAGNVADQKDIDAIFGRLRSA